MGKILKHRHKHIRIHTDTNTVLPYDTNNTLPHYTISTLPHYTHIQLHNDKYEHFQNEAENRKFIDPVPLIPIPNGRTTRSENMEIGAECIHCLPGTLSGCNPFGIGIKGTGSMNFLFSASF